MTDDTLLRLIASEAVKSPIVAREIASYVVKRSDIMNLISDKLDGKLMGKAIGEAIVYAAANRTGSMISDNAQGTYKAILAEARIIAANIIAKDMVETMRTV